MDHAFYTWLQQNASPGRFEVLVVAIDTLRDLLGPQLDDLTINVIARVGYDDKFGSLDRLESDLLDQYSIASVPFGVHLNTEFLVPEHLHKQSALLRALLVLDKYELVNSLLGILEGEYSNEELVAELAAEVMYMDAEDFLPLIREVDSSLITRIRDVVDYRLAQQASAVEAQLGIPETDSFTPEERTRLVAFVGRDEPNPIGDYIANGGVCGLPLDRYVQFFGHYLSSVANPKTAARGLIAMALMARIAPVEMPKFCGQYLDQIYNNIHRIMPVRKELVAIAKTFQG